MELKDKIQGNMLRVCDVTEAVKELKEAIAKKCRERYLESDGIICEEGDICNECKEKIELITKIFGELK